MKVYRLKNNKPIVIREATTADAADLNELVYQVLSTSTFTLTTVPEINNDLDFKKEWLREFEQDKNSKVLVAEYEQQLVGTLDFKAHKKIRNRHSGEFGMGLRKDFRNQGLGRIILQELIDWGAQHPQLEKICLGVFTDNHAAIHLYKSMGFQEEGCFVKAIKVDAENYADELRMYRFV